MQNTKNILVTGQLPTGTFSSSVSTEIKADPKIINKMKATMSRFDNWLNTFIEEKGIDLEETFEVEGPSGTNFMSLEIVVEAIKSAPSQEQKKIKDMMVMIDFKNAKIEPYLKHLAQEIAA